MSQGVIPATIGVVGGHVFIGMSKDQIQELAEESSQAVKISRRDLPYVLAKKMSGGTTVAATMMLAHKASMSHTC